jgi:drug/metabolite transporter (DMT)-like permease
VSRRTGILLCGLSATAFGLLGPFGVLAFDTGLDLSTVIGWRFILAALLLWVLVGALRRAVGRGRALVQPFLMGAVVYASQTGLYFLSLQRVPVGLAALLLYTMPVMVVLLSMLGGREPVRVLTLTALALSVGGVAVTLLGTPAGQVSILGVSFGLASAVVYTAYYLAMEALPPSADRLTAAALVCTGAALTHVLVGSIRRAFDPTPNGVGLAWVAAMALICTVVAIALLLIGIQGAGASSASVVSCLEPITAVVLGVIFFADPFGPAQWIGTAAVVSTVVILAVRRTAAAEDHEPRPLLGAHD